jgi:hypothetical protein
MLLHEVLEKAPAPLLIFRDFLLQCRYRQSAYLAYCEGSGDRKPENSPHTTAAVERWPLTCGRTEIKLIPVVVSGKRHEPRVPSPLP